MEATFRDDNRDSIYNPKWLARVRAKQRIDAQRKTKLAEEARLRAATVAKIEETRKADALVIAAKLAEVERLSLKVSEQQTVIARMEAERLKEGLAPNKPVRRFSYAEIEARADEEASGVSARWRAVFRAAYLRGVRSEAR